MLTILVKDLNSPTNSALLLFYKPILQFLYDACATKGSSSSPVTLKRGYWGH